MTIRFLYESIHSLNITSVKICICIYIIKNLVASTVSFCFKYVYLNQDFCHLIQLIVGWVSSKFIHGSCNPICDGASYDSVFQFLGIVSLLA